MSVLNNAFGLLMTPDAAAPSGYTVERSLRFNSSDSAYLSRTPASAGNRRTWTWAGWVKRSGLSANGYLLEAGASDTASARFIIRFSSDNTLLVSRGQNADRITSQVFRDVSAWCHLVVACDTTQATPNDRIKIYFNGTQITTFSSTSNPGQNDDLGVNAAAIHAIGRSNVDSGDYFNGYLADIHFIDGQALTPSSFTEVSATTGQLIPKAYTGSFGTNGFWLQFADNSNNTATTLGKDTSGNNNDWTPFNLQTTTGGPTSVAAASGALPIYNTTDTYGAVKGSGTRTDANASSLVLAIPMDGANNGTTFTDESATIRGSGSAISISRNVATTTTSFSKYYGSSGNFNNASDYLGLGTGVPTELQIGQGDFCIEFWWYPTSTASNQHIYGNLVNSNGSGHVWVIANHNFSTGSTLTFGNGSTNLFFGSLSNPVPANAWNHIAITRAGTSVRCFLNGAQLGAAQTLANWTNNTTNQLKIGEAADGNYPITGYLQDFRVYKGVAKYTSNFNPPNSTQNPSIAAGNDSLVDTPTSYGTDTGAGGEVRGNYCTLNGVYHGSTLSNGNLDYASGSAYIGSVQAVGTVGVSSGKWYWEVLCVSSSSSSGYLNTWMIGFVRSDFTQTVTIYNQANNALYFGYSGNKFVNNSISSYGATFTNGDVIGVAMDIDSGAVTFYKNGVSQGSISYTFSGTYMPCISNGDDSSSVTATLNFGQRPFAYTAPSGFKALCDTNLTAPVVAKPSEVMDVKLYTGNGSTQTISGLGFSPDFVWLKARSAAERNVLFDQVRGAGYRLLSDGTESEALETNTLSAFTSNGFSVGVSNGVNGSGTSMVAWTWDAGSSTVTNTQGSITSSVRANASAGFSIVTYTGNATAGATVGHGLGVAPALIINKQRSGTNNWWTYHASLGATKYLVLDGTNAVGTANTVWNDTAPTSTVFSIGVTGVTNTNSATYVSYCFAPVAGYSSFGSYTGNGSTDGPFVYTGFRPRWILVKRTDGVIQWTILDTARSPSNVADQRLFPNLSQAETVNGDGNTDLLSNGFKPRNIDSAFNANGGTYIYAAFAENPFQYARAR